MNEAMKDILISGLVYPSKELFFPFDDWEDNSIEGMFSIS